MNASRKTRTGLVVIAAELIVCLLAGASFGGVGIGIGGIGVGISVGRGGHRGQGGQRAPSVKKQLQGRRNGPVARVAPRVLPGRTSTASAPSGQHTALTKTTATKSAPARVAAPTPASKFPLELVDVRLIDIGNVASGEGPRFRVVVKNVTSAPLKRPLELMISAGISDAFSPALPAAVQEIEPLGPGQAVAVELRLPAESMAMAYPGRKQPLPFSMLFVLVGGPKNLLGSSSITKLAVRPLGEVRLADIAIAPPASRDVTVGLPLELQGEGFGPQTGQVLLTVGGVKLNMEILGWNELGIAVRMPKLALAQSTKVQLQVMRADGQPAKPLALTAVLPDVSVAAAEDVPFPLSVPQSPAAQPTVEPESAATPTSAGSEILSDAQAETSAEQQPLSLAQAFGELGLPPSDK